MCVYVSHCGLVDVSHNILQLRSQRILTHALSIQAHLHIHHAMLYIVLHDATPYHATVCPVT